MADFSKQDYASAMAHLEAGCIQKGIASINFHDGQAVMITLDKLRDLAEEAEKNGQERVLIFIQRGPIMNPGAPA